MRILLPSALSWAPDLPFIFMARTLMSFPKALPILGNRKWDEMGIDFERESRRKSRLKTHSMANVIIEKSMYEHLVGIP